MAQPFLNPHTTKMKVNAVRREKEIKVKTCGCMDCGQYCCIDIGRAHGREHSYDINYELMYWGAERGKEGSKGKEETPRHLYSTEILLRMPVPVPCLATDIEGYVFVFDHMLNLPSHSQSEQDEEITDEDGPVHWYIKYFGGCA